MQAYGNSFIYNGFSSEDLDLVLCAFGSENNSPAIVKRQGITSEMNQYRPYQNYKGMEYTDVLRFPVSFMKADAGRLTRDEIRQITAVLTSPSFPRAFSIEGLAGDDEQVYENLVYYGVFDDEFSYFEYGGVKCGFTATFTCNAPYPFEPYTASFACQTTAVVTIDNTSDELEMSLSPVLRITPHSSGLISIDNQTNTTQGPCTLNCMANNVITLDSRRKKLTDINGRPYSFEYFNLTWPRLIPGKNKLLLSGNFDLEIQCEFPRKVGI